MDNRQKSLRYAASVNNGREPMPDIVAPDIMEEIPRRSRIDLLTPEENAIRDCVIMIEKMAAAHPLLADVQVLLMQARNKLADWIDLPKHHEPQPDLSALAPLIAEGYRAIEAGHGLTNGQLVRWVAELERLAKGTENG